MVMVGGELTVRVAVFELTDPHAFVIVTLNNAPLSAEVAGGVVYVVEIAPIMDIPFLDHWYENGAVPVAVTKKVAVAPSQTV